MPAVDVDADAEEPAVAAIVAGALAPTRDPDAAFDLGDLDPELVDIFVEEAGDLLDHSDDLLAQLRESPPERQALAGLHRALHTQQGGAGMGSEGESAVSGEGGVVREK